jgi:hypothetical protein
MLVRAFLPAGWMPNPTGSANAPFVLCTLDGPSQLALGVDGKPLKHQGDQNGDRHEVCPFAASPHLATPIIAAALALPDPTGIQELGAVYMRVAESNAAYAPQSPRAPPQIS